MPFHTLLRSQLQYWQNFVVPTYIWSTKVMSSHTKNFDALWLYHTFNYDVLSGTLSIEFDAPGDIWSTKLDELCLRWSPLHIQHWCPGSYFVDISWCPLIFMLMMSHDKILTPPHVQLWCHRNYFVDKIWCPIDNWSMKFDVFLFTLPTMSSLPVPCPQHLMLRQIIEFVVFLHLHSWCPRSYFVDSRNFSTK